MTKFSDLNLNPKVLKAVEEAGYESPTPIQAGAIPPALEGRDVLGIAQTGTGKTASFTLPMITLLARGRARARMPRSLVLCPTRELAAQVAENFDAYTKHLKLTKALLIGGVSFKEQDALIDKGVDVLIATPGRLLDHFERGKLILSDVKVMVVDEADRMLDMGFIPDIERIFGLTPFTRQTLFFSATMAPEIERITNTFLSAPERVEVARQATTSENITQGVVLFKASRRDREGSEKRKLLRHLIDQEGEKCTNAIIFCNRKTDVDICAKSLRKYGYNAAAIHGDLDQAQRMKTLDEFREGTLRILVASDVAARGLDVPSVSHVFNFDVPGHAEDYVHRIGRTGRAGRDGTAMMICVPKDEKNLEDIERLVQQEIPRIENPFKKAKAEAKSKDKDDAKDGEATERKTRSRRGGRNKDAAKEDATVTEAANVEDRPVDTAQSDTAKSEAANAGDSKPASGPGKSASKGHQKSGHSRGRNGNNDRVVVGMGDHLPSFIALSFAERRAS
ncbi:DEAD/DEAH box helicase [Phaeobacter sp.]|uniref:DEAD/DEAH box helicase n=1 Tax=Phaeobacter sp. TaxID=1902409 RepID=UPI0025EBB158|nr:DEAD/DEAH box helicase [Phaeobacter sp.]